MYIRHIHKHVNKKKQKKTKQKKTKLGKYLPTRIGYECGGVSGVPGDYVYGIHSTPDLALEEWTFLMGTVMAGTFSIYQVHTGPAHGLNNVVVAYEMTFSETPDPIDNVFASIASYAYCANGNLPDSNGYCRIADSRPVNTRWKD